MKQEYWKISVIKVMANVKAQAEKTKWVYCTNTRVAVKESVAMGCAYRTHRRPYWRNECSVCFDGILIS